MVIIPVAYGADLERAHPDARALPVIGFRFCNNPPLTSGEPGYSHRFYKTEPTHASRYEKAVPRDGFL